MLKRPADAWLLGAVLLTPPALWLAATSTEAGHGDYFFAKVFFPYTMLSTHITGYIHILTVVFACVQIPLYGILVGWDTERPRRNVAFAIASLHAAAVAACFAFSMEHFA